MSGYLYGCITLHLVITFFTAMAFCLWKGGALCLTKEAVYIYRNKGQIRKDAARIKEVNIQLQTKLQGLEDERRKRELKQNPFRRPGAPGC